jgi:hypothetical protein
MRQWRQLGGQFHFITVALTLAQSVPHALADAHGANR